MMICLGYVLSSEYINFIREGNKIYIFRKLVFTQWVALTARFIAKTLYLLTPVAIVLLLFFCDTYNLSHLLQCIS